MTGVITEYLGQGLAADRPATPDVATGGLAIYFATDTETYSFYDANDAAWQDIPLTAATRASLGLDTTDSPQFAALNIGHASDTTVTRVSAGVIAVEGKTIPNLTDGGTFAADISVPDEAYDATAWNGSMEVPTKNAIRDKLEAIGVGFTTEDAQDAVGAMVDSTLVYTDATPLLTRAALTGDVTASAGSNATTIANNAVSLAKLATMATDSILGRATASTGNVEVLTALPFAYTGDVTRPADSNVTTIANDAVTLAKIQNATANSKLLGSGASGSGADYAEITLGTNLSMSGTTLNASGSASFRGALAKKAADETTANYTTVAAVPWTAEEYDTDTIHDNSTNNTRLTVPSGVTKIRLVGGVFLGAYNASQWMNIYPTKNGGNLFVGLALQTSYNDALTGPGAAFSTPVIAVTAGDYFECMLQVKSDTSITVNSSTSYFAMEIVA